MIYDLNNPISQRKAVAYFERLCKLKPLIEMKKVIPIRSTQQNRYLHLILSYFAVEYGETADYVKQYFFKQVVNRDLFKTEYTNPKTGEVRTDWRSTADLDSKELTEAIEKFRDWAIKEAGVLIPAPNEDEFLRHCQEQVEQGKRWI